MNPRSERSTIIITTALIVGVAALTYLTIGSLAPASIPDSLPAQLSDAEFWQMVEDFSEPSGIFRSDNFLSNEAGSQDVIPTLRARVNRGGVYLGVGPEQNFTYIQALDSKMAFIVDIRRNNMIEHLLYKAIFELSANRSDFVSRLFSRQPQGEPGIDSTPNSLFEAYEHAVPDNKLFEKNLVMLLNHLTATHRFKLSADDEANLRYVYNAFFQAGPQLSYTFLGSYYQGRLTNMPSYRELMSETDRNGRNWSFLATEDQFRKVQQLQKKNLIIPLVGNFAGPKAIRAVGAYLREHNAVLTVFYTSNVEMYLFQQGNDWKHFYGNVATLPVNSTSSFIRFAVNRRMFGFGGSGVFGRRSQMWSSIEDILFAVDDGNITRYADVIEFSK